VFRAVLIPAAVAFVCAGAQAESLGDPTQPTPLGGVRGGGNEAPAAPRWVLSSTLVARDRNVAVINGEQLEVGETVAGARVVRIRPGRVILERGGRRFELSMLADSVKQPSRDARGAGSAER